MDNPKAINQQPAAAKVLAAMLEKLRTRSSRPSGGSADDDKRRRLMADFHTGAAA
jgi:hypothetical protein